MPLINNRVIYFEDYNESTNKYEKYLGKIKAGVTAEVKINKTADCLPITALSSTCGCTVPQDRPDHLFVQFTPSEGTVTSHKMVYVTFNDGTQVTISIKADIYR